MKAGNSDAFFRENAWQKTEKLFAFERSYREKGFSHKQIYNRRLKDEKPVIEGFLAWLKQVDPGSNGKLKKAITYVP